MKQLFTTLLIAAGFAGTALAQEAAPEAPAPEGAAEGALPEFTAVDRNQDGMIDEGEAEVLTEVLKESNVEFDFATADANEDGGIDSAEYTQYQEELIA